MSIEDDIQVIKQALLARMGTKSCLRPAGLIDALVKSTEKTPLTVRQCLARLMKDHWLDGVANDGTPFRNVTITGPLPAKPAEQGKVRWDSVLSRRSDITQADKDILSPLWKNLGELEEDELGCIAEGLCNLRSKFGNEIGRHRFLISANYLIGSSKLLDALASPSLRTFGIDVEKFPAHPYHVVVAGSENPEAVVLVENPAALELAMSTSASTRCAFVATFGFGLSRGCEDYGNQLVAIVEDRFDNTVTLTREGSNCPPARVLLAHPQITFWGDLDIAGMQIYLRLKKSIPSLRLSALYAPMITSLKSIARSHRYLESVNKSGQHGMLPSCPLAEREAMALMSLCASRGVDQEQVTTSEIERLAAKPLELS